MWNTNKSEYMKLWITSLHFIFYTNKSEYMMLLDSFSYKYNNFINYYGTTYESDDFFF